MRPGHFVARPGAWDCMESACTMSHLPSTKSLRAFEAAARLGSIKAAADLLHLTPSAVSRRIQTLEEELGQALFMRDMQGITLTEAGRGYAEQLRGIFRALDQATAAVRRPVRRRLTVAGPAVVIQACMDNLYDIDDSLQDLDLSFHSAIITTASHSALAQADVAFFWGKGGWDGWQTRPITSRTHLVPLCAPALLESGRLLRDEELPEHNWIVPVTFEESWALWFQALDVPMPEPKRLTQAADANAAIQMARRGAGIAMLSGFSGLPNFHVLAGSLVPAHAFHAFAHDYAFHIGVRAGDDNPDLAHFSAWFFTHVWSRAALARWLAAQKQA